MKKRLVALLLMIVIFSVTVLTSCDAVLGAVDGLFGNQDSEQNGDQNGDQNEDQSGDQNGAQNDDQDPGYSDALALINVPERFKKAYTIDREKLELAASKATAKLKDFAKKNGIGFIKTCSEDYLYPSSANNNWTCGMYTGSYLMAYQITGDKFFADVVNEHVKSYVEREAKKVGMDDHDVGFVFVPSCVGAYKVLGSETAKDAAARAVEYYYGTGYSQEGKFIIRAHSWNDLGGYRTMIDSLMNASLFLWAGKELGNENYTQAGLDHNLTTVDLIVRDDGSTYHHYQFDPVTSKPLYGLTWQGYSDESCWSRGHSWGIYGFSIAFSYTKNVYIKDAQRAAVYYMLNHLPEDLIPYWDYTFRSGSEPRDSSAAAIAVCGMLDMASQLPENSAQRLVYESAAAQIMEAIIDKCTTDIGVEYDGLIHSVTHGKPQNLAVGECAPYADYFYLEALARYLKHDFIRPW